MAKKIDAESVRREDMPSYKDRSMLSRTKNAIDEGYNNLPEMMRRKTAAETDAGKGEGILQKLVSPYKTDRNSEYNKRNSATSANYNATNRAANRPTIADEINAEPKPAIKAPVNESPKTTDTPTKKAEPVVAVKKTQTVAMSKPKGPSEAARRAADWAAFSKGREADTAALKDITDRYTNPEDMNTQGKLDAAEDSEYKKGGQIKRRPPKPAKKVPTKRFASGGMSRSSASKRADGCATKGHTKGKYL